MTDQPDVAGEPTRGDGSDADDRLLRALADLDNLRKRYARDLARERAEERARATAAWLPVVDNLELALEHAHANPADIIKGVRGVHDQAVGVLSRLGYPRQDDVGERFDPARHEAVTTMHHPDATPGTVLHVIRPRYGEGQGQLRPAAVVVSTHPAPTDGGTKSDGATKSEGDAQ